MKKRYILLTLLIMSFAAACSSVAAEESVADIDQAQNVAVNSEVVIDSLSTDYDDALDEAGQLAIGTLIIEQGELAITAEQAETLLPLWQALQSLSGSDATAGAEVDAVVNQIMRNMSAEQIAEIATLQLTTESFGELVQSGAIQLGGRGGPAPDGAEGAEGGRAGGPPAGGLGGNGGGPGGPGGAGGADLSEEEIEARRAERFGDGGADANTGFMTNAVINLLSAKVGIEVENNRGPNLNNIISTVVATELDVTIADIRAVNDVTLAEYIETEGGDVETIRSLIIAELNASENVTDFDIEMVVDNWLYGVDSE